jgi:hypothetical protein
MKFHENQFGGSRVTCGQTDMVKLLVTVLQLLVSNVPKKPLETTTLWNIIYSQYIQNLKG